MHIARPHHFPYDTVEIIEETAEGVFEVRLKSNGNLATVVYEDEDDPEAGFFLFPDTTIRRPAAA